MFESSRQVDILKPPPGVWTDFRNSLEKMGKITVEDQEGLVLRGTAKYGLQKVLIKVVIEWVPQGSRITLRAFSDDIWGSGAKDAISRLLTVYQYRDNPNYVPPREGYLRYSTLFTAVVFVFAILLKVLLFLPGDLKHWIFGLLIGWGMLVLPYVVLAQWRFLRS